VNDRGQCPVCAQWVRIRRNGKIRMHARSQAGAGEQDRPRCEGSGRTESGAQEFIYVVGCGDPTEYVKIGRASDLGRRVSQLQTGCPYKLTLLGWMETQQAERDEQRLHTKYQRFRESGEWFFFSKEIREFVLSDEVQKGAQVLDAIDGIAYPEILDGIPSNPMTTDSHRPTDESIVVDLVEQTRKALATLTPREEKVLRMRFGIGIGEATEDGGAEFHVTRERIRRIEAKALGVLRRRRGPKRPGNLMPTR
jgi:hypothetical protein